MSKKAPTISERFQKAMLEIAKKLNTDPSLISKAEYYTTEISCDKPSEWQLRQLGGFYNAQNLMFPPQKDVVMTSASKMVRGFRNKLENRYGKEIFLKEEFLSVFKEVMAANPIKLHRPVKPKKSNKKLSRSLVVHFSDTHYGCNIDSKEVDNLNAFNWTIAARRSAFLMDQAVKYKPQHRDETELVILINGDIIAGVIHDQEWGVDLLTTQFAGALSIFGQAISYGAQHFKKVRVICTPGNHGRAMHKSNKDRATSHKWDSYENMIYIALREMFKDKYKNVSFEIPESPYAIATIQGHKFMITHGDTVINVGNPGRNLNMRSINEQINRANSQLIPGEENFAAIVVGHVHVSTIQETDSGTMLLINGTLSGLDPYAHSLGIYSKNATQQIFEVVPGHPVGDIRMIRLKNADNLKELDKIIKPFSGKF
jgi:UDP-2,3-diacylglucosamine pyrophosphatase LpxH